MKGILTLETVLYLEFKSVSSYFNIFYLQQGLKLVRKKQIPLLEDRKGLTHILKGNADMCNY